MPPPSKTDVENMAFKALMGSIGVGHLPCDCPTCSKSPRLSPRPEAAKRKGSDKEKTESTSTVAPSSGACGHHHHHHHHHRGPESRPPVGSRKASGATLSQTKTLQSASTAPGRSDKVNSLLKAETQAAIFDVFNATTTTNDEKELVAQIQSATQECKTYPDSKTRIIKLCDSTKVGNEAVFGLLAKFRHERNLLTTAILKSNAEREKALLCIKRVDDLMYMLSDVSKKPKDSSSEGVMASLGEIIMEVHEIARHPSVLYEELLEIRDDHLQLLDDHDDMHQKFVDVNSCHDRLHTNYEKLQTSNTKLNSDYIESKKKASLVNGLKQDVIRLEKAIEKKQGENVELKKEVEKLNGELGKVNALRHEVAQLKKKITSSSAQSAVETPASLPVVVEKPASAQPAALSAPAKKKKGKKGNNTVTVPAEGAASEKSFQGGASMLENSPSQEELLKLQKSYEAAVQELALLRENLAHIDRLRQKADRSREQAAEKLQLVEATSQNWQELSESHAEDNAKLQGQVDHFKSVIQNLQWTTKKQEETLSEATRDLTTQKSAFEQIKAELDNRSQTPATSITDKTTPLTDDALRMLRKVRGETAQLMRDVDDSVMRNIDLPALLHMIQITIYRIVADAEGNIDEMLNGSSSLASRSTMDPALPPSYPRANLTRNLPPQSFDRYEGSPQLSPNVSLPLAGGALAGMPSYRPSIPPGFGDLSPMSSPLHSSSRKIDSPVMSNYLHPISKSAALTADVPAPHAHHQSPVNDFGPIGSRIPSSSLRSLSSLGTKASDLGGNKSPPPPSTTLAPGAAPTNSGLGNGAHGVDWSMWSKMGK